jgi:hypothetical protein
MSVTLKRHTVDFVVEKLSGVRSSALRTEAVIAQDIGFGSTPVRIALEAELLLHFRTTIVVHEIGNAFAVGCSTPLQIEISLQPFTSQYNFLICIGGAWD